MPKKYFLVTVEDAPSTRWLEGDDVIEMELQFCAVSVMRIHTTGGQPSCKVEAITDGKKNLIEALNNPSQVGQP